ncbi:hypothetical protein BH11ACT3_BH11ACT3_07950 [soil metagenome]
MRLDPAHVDRIRRIVDPWSAAFQLTILHNDETVMDVRAGCEADDLFWTFSASKPFIALLTHWAAERGLLELDAPVARYWPEFAAGGKGEITLRQVLQHRTGLPTAGSALGDAFFMPNWNRTIRRIEKATVSAPASGPAYQFVIFGFVLGEVLRRVTGEPIEALLRRVILEPLELRDTYLGLPTELWPRHRDITVDGAGRGTAGMFLNRLSTWEAVIPSAGIATTSRDLSVFYAELLRERRGSGLGIVSRETLRNALRPTSDGERDRFARTRIRWSEGFQLGGPRAGADASPTLAAASRRAFGHNGSNSCFGWADPKRRISVAYLTDRLPRPQNGMRQFGELTAAIVAAVDASSAKVSPWPIGPAHLNPTESP